ncbi:unnamed protein product [Urochloa decumbens]|uniref:F-box domain-containing protein n=1 Tax=Urochloa decumbens TaxID=240449 RepID=A0ABC9GX95_9POAL
MDSPKQSAAAAALLPDDALLEILSCLPAKSLCRFKCVSRSWRDLIADRLRCTNLPQALEGFFFDGDEGGDNNDDDDAPVVYGHFINTLGKPAPLASYSFLGNVPGIQEFGLLRSCNGLLLFSHKRVGDTYNSLGYIVCNPATEQWVAVASSGFKPISLLDEGEDPGSDSDNEIGCTFTYLIFDPALSSHFQLVEFVSDDCMCVVEVHAYSSETGVWRHGDWTPGHGISFFAGAAFVNGMLHLSVTSFVRCQADQELIVAVDGEGKKCRIIHGPEKHADVAFVGQSQGRLHCMNQHSDNAELSIWVLEDYDAQEWVLKHSVAFLQLFGWMSCRVHSDYSVIAIHPDRNLIFFLQHWGLELKPYDMDSQEVCTLCTVGAGRKNIVPYVPYFAESPALTSKH